jgi:hypothetical protein
MTQCDGLQGRVQVKVAGLCPDQRAAPDQDLDFHWRELTMMRTSLSNSTAAETSAFRARL